MSTARVDFTRSAAERIAAVVRQVEGGNRDGSPLTFRRVETPPGAVFHICTFSTASWSKNTTRVVTLKYTVSSSLAANQFTATNLFASIGTATSTRNCAIARQGTAWFLVAAECG